MPVAPAARVGGADRAARSMPVAPAARVGGVDQAAQSMPVAPPAPRGKSMQVEETQMASAMHSRGTWLTCRQMGAGPEEPTGPTRARIARRAVSTPPRPIAPPIHQAIVRFVAR